jgi:hypothetical protein
MRKTLFSAVSLAALVTGGIPAALAGPPSKATFPEDFIIFDTCTGEDVHFTGSETTSVAVSTNNDIFHFYARIYERLDGVGLTTGAQYKASREINSEENASFSGFPIEQDAVINEQLIGQGAVANQTLKSTFHITINANGTITVNRSSIEFACHG